MQGAGKLACGAWRGAWRAAHEPWVNRSVRWIGSHVRGWVGEQDARVHGAVAAPSMRLLTRRAVRGALSVEDGGLRVRLGEGGGVFDASWLWVNDPVHWDASTGQRITAVSSIPEPGRLRVSSVSRAEDGRVRVEWDYGGWRSEGGGPQPAWSLFSTDWLQQHAYASASVGAAGVSGGVWAGSPLMPGPNAGPAAAAFARMDWAALRDSEQGALRLGHELAVAGAVIVEGCPTGRGSVLEVAGRVAPAMPTIYGTTFDVVAEAEEQGDDAGDAGGAAKRPINVAYSTAALEPHIDLVYYESPPGLQLLLTRRFDGGVPGGESTMVDGMAAAELLRQRDPAAFLVLCTVPATFQKVHYARARPAHMVYHRPHIATAHSGAAVLATAGPRLAGWAAALRSALERRGGAGAAEAEAEAAGDLAELAAALGPVTGVFWAPPFEGPLRVTAEWVRPYMGAYRALERVICGGDPRRPPHARAAPGDHVPWLEHRLAPGQCLVFNNRRMLHGRRTYALRHAMPPTPQERDRAAGPLGTPFRRHLEGCYVNIDEFASRLRHLHVAVGAHLPDTIYHVGNQTAEGHRLLLSDDPVKLSHQPPLH
jgi:hypothetical protein